MEESRKGTSVRIFLVDGTPEGLRVVEKSNWTGIALMCSRAQFADVRGREEFAHAGVYVLLGTGESGRPTVYVGEADGVAGRIDSHVRKKDFWTHLILFTSKDGNLNKAHVQYLEARLIELGQAAKRYDLENANSPALPSLSEADIADAEHFLDDMLLIYPLLGLTAFEQPSRSSADARSVLLHLSARGVTATARELPEGFVALKGSQASKDTTPSTPPNIVAMREDLIRRGVFVAASDHFELSQDFAFGSPSTAAACLIGRSSNGREVWKDSHGTSLAQLQDAAIELDARRA